MFFFGILFFSTEITAIQLNGNLIKIGVVANGSSDNETVLYKRHGQTVSLVRYLVDTSEIYQIFRSVMSLDADGDVDVITMFDYGPSVLQMSHILQTNNKMLIMWGPKKTGTNNGQTDESLVCGTKMLPEHSYGDPFCRNNATSTSENIYKELITLVGPQVLSALIETLSWKSVIILYDTSAETETTELVDRLSKKRVLFAMFNTDHVTDLHELLLSIYHQVEIRENPTINVVVLCQLICTRNILKTANELDALHLHHQTLLKKISRWLVAVYGQRHRVSYALRPCADDLDNVAIIAIPELTRTGIEDLYDSLDPIMWEIANDMISGGQIEVKQTIIARLLERAAAHNPVNICHAYNIDTLLWQGSGRVFTSVGHVDNTGNVSLLSDIFPNSNFGYNKRQFLVSTLPYPPFVIKKKINDSYVYEGFCMDLLDELSRLLNFTYRLTEPEDRKWGTFIFRENLTFNGLVGQLQREEVDIVAAPLATQADRSMVMDFSYPFYFEYTTLLVAKPDVNATKWRTLIHPFKWKVLLSIGISLLTVTVLVFLIEKYNPFYVASENAEERGKVGGLHTLRSSFWYMYGCLLCQGGVHLPTSTAGRTLVSCWWLFCIVIVGTYSGNLIAFLTVTKEKPPFNSVAEMVKLKDSYKWGTLSGTHWEIVFTTSSADTYRAIGDGLRKFNQTDPDIMHPSLNVHIDKVMNEKYVWIGDKTSIETAMSTECSLMSVKEEFLPMKYAFGFTNSSPHTTLFSEQMIKMHEGGLFHIWKRKWWPKANFCVGDIVMEAKPISLMDVQSAFYVCLIGIFLGVSALLIEIIIYKFRQAKKTQHQSRIKGTASTDNILSLRRSSSTF